MPIKRRSNHRYLTDFSGASLQFAVARPSRANTPRALPSGPQYRDGQHAKSRGPTEMGLAHRLCRMQARRRNTSAEIAICACHQDVSVRAGKSATTMASSEVRAFATHLPISRPYGGLRNTFPRQGSIKPSSLRLKYVRAPLTAGLLDRSDRLGSIGTRLGLQSGVDPRRA